MNTPTTTEKKNKTPKLVCNITGQSRNTTREYLDSRLARLKCTEATFLENYANKDSIKALRSGKTVAQIRQSTQSTLTTPISDTKLKIILAMNGKQPKPVKVEAPKTAETKTAVAA